MAYTYALTVGQAADALAATSALSFSKLVNTAIAYVSNDPAKVANAFKARFGTPHDPTLRLRRTTITTTYETVLEIKKLSEYTHLYESDLINLALEAYLKGL